MQGTGGNWWQHAIIQDSFSGCERGHRVRVDWLWNSDQSAPNQNRWRKKRPRPASEASDLGTQRRALGDASGSGAAPFAAAIGGLAGSQPRPSAAPSTAALASASRIPPPPADGSSTADACPPTPM